MDYMLQSKDARWLDGKENKTLNTCCLQETHFRLKDAHRLKVKDVKKLCRENRNKKKKSGVAILIPDKIDFKTKAIPKDKEGPSNSTSGHFTEESGNIALIRHTHLYVHCRIIDTVKIQEQPNVHQ